MATRDTGRAAGGTNNCRALALADDHLLNHSVANHKAYTIAQPESGFTLIITGGGDLRVEPLMRQVNQRLPNR
jgi:hypothetical protein